jgi:indolepyruvate ferredoxin oxidoreductase beta subunit
VTGVLLAGVGGQGILLAGGLLAEAALAAGLDVKKSEVHGMAQRGGSVVTHVRFGPEVHSPLISEGEADFLVAFEEIEALRYLHLLRPGATLIASLQRIYTLSMLTGAEPYPAQPLEDIRHLPLEVIPLDGVALAREAGNPRTVNLVVLGALAARLPWEQRLWEEVIRRVVPARFLDVNLKAFHLGLSAGRPGGGEERRSPPPGGGVT